MKCVKTNYDSYEAAWIYWKNAWVAAITVCQFNMTNKPPTRPSDARTPGGAVLLEFDNISDEMTYRFREGFDFWIKWDMPGDLGSGVDVVLIGSGLDADLDLDMSEFVLYDSDLNELAVAEYYWHGTDEDDQEYQAFFFGPSLSEGETYYVSIRSQFTGEFRISVKTD